MSTPESARIKLLIKKHQAGSPELNRALIHVGRMLTNQTKLNIRRKRLFDTGNLFNSIQFEVYSSGDKSGVNVGSVGVPYAAAWEFGQKGKLPVGAHKRNLKAGTSNVRGHTRRGYPVKAHKRTREDSISEVRSHMRNVNRKARPFLQPAFDKLRDRINKTLMEALS